MSEKHELSFYRDLHKVAFFLMLVVNTTLTLAAVLNLWAGEFKSFLIVAVLWFLGGQVIRFLFRRAWPAKYDEVVAELAKSRSPTGASPAPDSTTPAATP